MRNNGNEPEEVVLQGIVCPWGWDAQNNVTNVLLSGKGECNYYVEPDGQGRTLIPHCGKHVELHGLLRRDKGVSLLKVLWFEETTPL